MRPSNGYFSRDFSDCHGGLFRRVVSAASKEPSNSTPQQVFDGMRQSFRANQAKGRTRPLPMELSGPQGGNGGSTNDGAYKMGKGKIDHPNVTPGHGQRLGRRLQWPTRRDVGVSYRAAKSSRGPRSGEKARGNLPLELRFSCDSEVGSRIIRPLGLMGAEEIKVPFDRHACPRNDLKRFEAGITYLQTGAILAVLHDSVVQVQFVLSVRDDIVSSKAGVVKLAEDPEFPIVIWLINQRRLGKNRLESKLIGEEPDDAAAERNRRVLINSPAHSDNRKDLVFLQRERHKSFPWDINSIPRRIILKINPWIDLDAYGWEVLHNVLQRQVTAGCLQMIR